MRELFKQATTITNNNIILTIPLIVFIKVLDLYSFFLMGNLDSAIKVIIASITILFMSGVFCAGWFYMLKGAICMSKKVFVLDSDRANASMKLFKCFPEGVGKFFLSFVGAYIILFFVQLLLTPIVYFIGLNLIGGLDEVSTQQLLQLTADSSINPNIAATTFVEQMNPEQIAFFGKWSLLFMLATSVIMYLLMLWVPEIIYKTSNPLVALYRSFIKLFKDFVNTLRLFLSIWFMGFALLFIYTFAVGNFITYIIVSILMFYFITYLAVLIFLYYNNKYAEEE